VLTLVLTPSLLALRVWVGAGAYGGWARLAAFVRGKNSAAARDLALGRTARLVRNPLIQWVDDVPPPPVPVPVQLPAAKPAHLSPVQGMPRRPTAAE
jgi:multidrug efflux pump